MCTKCIEAAASQAKDGQPTIEVVAMGDASNMPDELKAAIVGAIMTKVVNDRKKPESEESTPPAVKILKDELRSKMKNIREKHDELGALGTQCIAKMKASTSPMIHCNSCGSSLNKEHVATTYCPLCNEIASLVDNEQATEIKSIMNAIELEKAEADELRKSIQKLLN